MKKSFILFISALTLISLPLISCGGEEEEVVIPCVDLEPGTYTAKMVREKDDCKINKQEAEIDLTLKEGNELLSCGSHKEIDSQYSSQLQCAMSSILETTTTYNSIKGKFFINYKCDPSGFGYQFYTNKPTCTDEYSFVATPKTSK